VSDSFAAHQAGLDSPAESAFSITPADDSDLSHVTRGLYVGTSGDVKVDMANGDTVTFNSMSAGVVHWLRVKRVYSTGTTASDIVGVY